MVEFEEKLPTSIILEETMRDFEEEIKYEPNTYLCSLCNQVGHIARVCPKRVLQDKKEWRSKPPQEEPYIEEEMEENDPDEGEINSK